MSLSSRITFAGLAVALVLGCTTSGTAAVLTYDGTQQGDARGGGPYTIGSWFRVDGTSRNVSHLGAQDADAAVDAQDPDGADGLTGYADDDGFYRDTYGGGGGIPVGLWTGDGTTLLASVTVTSSDPVIGSWRYAPIAGGPITLQTGMDYLIGATVGGGIEWFIDGQTSGFNTVPFAADTGFTLLQNRFVSGGTLSAPINDGTDSVGRWGAANAILIPEPSTFLIWSLGLIALAAYAKRRRTK